MENEVNLDSKGTGEEEIRRLKKMVLTFKKKYQRALQDISKQEENLPHDAADIVKKCHELQEECDALAEQQFTLKEIINKNKAELTSLREENVALQQQQEILKKKVESQEENPQETIDSLKSQLAEKDLHLRQAQQHLAKKMKEIMEQRETIFKLENSIHIYIDQLNSENQETIAKEKELKDEIIQWENKYQEIHQQWQHAMDDIQGFKKLEEKYLKMQDYLKNLGNIIEGGHPSSKRSQKKDPSDELDLFKLR